MKKLFSGIILGILFCSILSTVFAEYSSKKIAVTYRDIKLFTDGTETVPRDVDGNIVEPFIYNGTTYLPVRAVGEALGRNVDWDNASSTVIISEKPTKPVYLFAEIPTNIKYRIDFSTEKSGDLNYIVYTPTNGPSSPDLSGMRDYENNIEYKIPQGSEKITGKILVPTCSANANAVVQVNILNENNDVLYQSEKLKSTSSKPIDFDVSINDCEKIIVEFKVSTNETILKECICKIQNLAIHTTNY